LSIRSSFSPGAPAGARGTECAAIGYEGSCYRGLQGEAPERIRTVTRRILSVAIALISFAFCAVWSDPAAAQVVSLSETTVAFGSVVVGLTSTRGITVTNTGTSNLVITKVSATAGFQANNCTNPTIVPKGNCTLSVSFTPAASGSDTGTLTITDNAASSPQTVSLTGTGVLGVSLNSTTLQFSSQAVGTTSPSQTITLLNDEISALSVTSVTTTGPFAATKCPASIPAAGSCAISVTFTPTATGDVSSTLTVVDGASSSPQTATLRGVGTSGAKLTSIAVTPANSSVVLGTTLQFTATGTFADGTMQTLTGPAVTWSAGGVVGGNSTVGTISTSGLYTPPATLPNPPQVTIKATSTATPSVSGSTTLTDTPVAVAVTVSPTTTQSVVIDQSMQFTATVTGTTNTAVTWSVNGIVGGNVITGTISTSGLYTSPPLPFSGVQVVTATSVADPTKSAFGMVRVIPPLGVNVSISPESIWLHTLQPWNFSASVLGTSNGTVTWSVAGVTGGNSTHGTISTSGLYTAPKTVPKTPQVTVTATSVDDPTKSASGTVTIAKGSFSATPLIDFTSEQLYLKQFSGMLYGGSNSPPPSHDAVGLATAAEVQPLDTSGKPSPSGQIVLLSLGMSEASDDWCDAMTNLACATYSFMGQAAASSSVNHTTLTILNGAHSADAAETWTCAYGNCPPSSTLGNNYDRVLNDVLTPSGLTEAQVQVVWIQQADTLPTWSPSLPSTSADAYAFEYQLGQIVRALMVRWPNVKQVFLSSRIYAGYALTNQNPEPYAYEYGFAVKWFINAQIVQRETGAIDPLAGDLLTAAPWVAWGPYLWGNGDNNPPGSMAISWVSTDFSPSDEMHPGPTGVTKVADALMNFFLNSTYTPWFRP